VETRLRNLSQSHFIHTVSTLQSFSTIRTHVAYRNFIPNCLHYIILFAVLLLQCVINFKLYHSAIYILCTFQLVQVEILNLWCNCKIYSFYILLIKPDFAWSVLAAICSLILTQYNVVQTAALLYLYEKLHDTSRSTMKKTFSLWQITKSVQYLLLVGTDCFTHISSTFFSLDRPANCKLRCVVPWDRH
jgi:hypothetical protein